MARYEYEEVLAILEPIVRNVGALVYDIELPRGGRGVLTVFVYSNTPRDSKVTHDECAKIAREILNLETVEDLIPGDCTLEVSSPGVNRKLRSWEHFTQSVGERVRVTGKVEGKQHTARGVLLLAADGTLEVEDEGRKTNVRFLFSDVKEARVDFLFD